MNKSEDINKNKVSEEITPSNHSLQNNQQVNRGAKTSELGILIDAEDRKKGKD